MRLLFAAALCAAALCARGAHAQEAPAGTPIEIEIRDTLDSKTSQRGDKFAFVLHAPISIDGQVVIPAGTPGVGEIVHAERARGGGKPGELILAARYLDFEGRQVKLRGMKLGTVGDDKSGKALGLSFIPVVGLFTYVRGGETVVPQGALAGAKLAEAFTVAAPEPAPAPAAVATPASVQDATEVPPSNNAAFKE